MLKIIVQKDNLSSLEKLKQILEDRQSRVLLTNGDTVVDPNERESSETCFICSKKYLQSINGNSGLIQVAKGFKANSIIVIDEKSDTFSIKEDLGGKLLHVNFPKNEFAENNTSNYGLHLVATLATKNNQFIAGDERTKKLVTLARKVAKTDVTVFINGPTGTGKEVLSKFIHNNSARGNKPFVGINCAAIPENMLEAILFGHEKGAFTGASSPNKGIFRAADGGTLLLDEISEMPLTLQSKLLRVLQEKIVTPIGSQKELSVDVRVIATTNRDMASEISNGNFREDLFYRLNVFPLATSHLTDRKDDVVPLTTALLFRHCHTSADIPWLDTSALETLLSHKWPGNVRELENIVQRALVLCSEKQICSSDIVIDNNPLNTSGDILSAQGTEQIAI